VGANKKTKSEWIKEQEPAILISSVLVSMFWACFSGLFLFGIGCICMNFVQAFGLGIATFAIVALASLKVAGRKIRRAVEEKAKTMKFRDAE
jgi:hypothetical protein